MDKIKRKIYLSGGQRKTFFQQQKLFINSSSKSRVPLIMNFLNSVRICYSPMVQDHQILLDENFFNFLVSSVRSEFFVLIM